jgi:hypothetical protein
VRRPLAACGLTLLLVATGCGNKRDAQGSGPPMNFCEGFYYEYTYLDEPDPDDPADVAAYAATVTRVVDRIKLHFRIELPKGPPLKIPPNIGPDLQTLKASMVRLRQEVNAAHGDKAEVRKAVNRLAVDEGFNSADGRLVDFATAKCPDSYK